MDVLTTQWGWIGGQGLVDTTPTPEPEPPPVPDIDTEITDDTRGTIGPRALLVYSATTERWWVYNEPPLALFVEEDTDLLTAGYCNGFVRNLEQNQPTTRERGADPENIATEIETKDFWGNSVRTRKLFLWVRVNLDASAGDASVELYVDGALKTRVTVSGARTRHLIPFPAACMGFKWRLRITTSGTARPIFYGAAAIWQTLMPA